MSRFTTAGIAALAVISLAACSDTLAPSKDMSVPNLALAKLSGTSDVEQIVPGQVLVKFKDGVNAESKAQGQGLGILRKGYADAFVIVGTARGNETALANVLKNDADVEWAEPNFLRQLDAINSNLWAFYNPGGLNMQYTSGGTGFISSSYASINDADEDNIENYAAGGADVTIGSIDTGVDLTHSEFTGRLINGTDWIDGGTPQDTEGHGTHTTGTMAGSTVGVAGVSGAAPHVKVLVQRVCDASGCPTSAIINAINAAASYIDASGHHLVAVNLSLGGSSESTGEQTAIQNATNNGVLVIASAGNSGQGRVACPACDVNAISVMATNWKDAKTSYSQYGKGLDIAAPGGECYSNTTPEGCIYSSYLGGGYEWLQGTSMAAPQVTGAAGVVASKAGLRGSALRSRLLSTTDKPSSISRYSVGRLNVYRAVTGTSLPAGQ
jgi:subtilisin family serine protease